MQTANAVMEVVTSSRTAELTAGDDNILNYCNKICSSVRDLGDTK